MEGVQAGGGGGGSSLSSSGSVVAPRSLQVHSPGSVLSGSAVGFCSLQPAAV